MPLRRLVQLCALLMIGDGVSGMVKPRWHSLLWDIGPKPFRAAMEQLVRNPSKACLLYIVEIGVGTWLATRQTPEEPGQF